MFNTANLVSRLFVRVKVCVRFVLYLFWLKKNIFFFFYYALFSVVVLLATSAVLLSWFSVKFFSLAQSSCTHTVFVDLTKKKKLFKKTVDRKKCDFDLKFGCLLFFISFSLVHQAKIIRWMDKTAFVYLFSFGNRKQQYTT